VRRLLLLALLAPLAAPAPAAPLPGGPRARLGTAPFPFLFAPDFTLAPPDYKALAFAGQQSELVRFAVDTAAPLDGKTTVYGQVLFSADGKRYVRLRDPDPVVRDAATGKPVRDLDVGRAPGSSAAAVALSADGAVLAVGVRDADGKVLAGGQADKAAKGGVTVWNVDRGRVLFRTPVIQSATPTPVLSADGKLLATRHHGFGVIVPGAADDDPGRVVQVWDVAAGKELFRAVPTVKGGEYTQAAAFSPDGSLLATSTGRGVVEWWDVKTGKPRPALRGRPGVGRRLAFSPDGKTLAAIGPGGPVQRWATADGALLGTTDAPDRLRRFLDQGLAFADNARVLAWGSEGNVPVVWEAPAGKWLTPLPEHTGAVYSVGFAAGGKEVVTAGYDGRVVRWDAATGKPLGPVQPRWDRDRPMIALSPDGSRGVSMHDPAAYDLKTGAEELALSRPPGGDRYPTTTVLVPDPTKAVVAFAPPYGKSTGTAAVWDLVGRRKLGEVEFPSDGGESLVALSPSGDRLVTVGRRNAGQAYVVTGWEVRTGKKVGEVEDATGGGPGSVAALGESGAAVMSRSGRLRAYDFEAGKPGPVVEEKPTWDWGGAGPVAVARGGGMIAVGRQGDRPDSFGARVYAWPSGKLLATFTGHRWRVTALAFSPDGKTLATGSLDTTVLLWDLTTIGK
jgi:WD40 repeat protein